MNLKETLYSGQLKRHMSFDPSVAWILLPKIPAQARMVVGPPGCRSINSVRSYTLPFNATQPQKISKFLLNDMWMDGPGWAKTQRWTSQLGSALHEFPSKHIYIQNITRIANACNHLQPLQGKWQSSGMQCLATSEIGKFLVMAAWGAWNDLGQDWLKQLCGRHVLTFKST